MSDLASYPAFEPAEAQRLMEVVRLSKPSYPRFSVGKLIIDLSWASSHLEGNTYTQLDSQVLIEYGERNKEKPPEDAAMILNHKRAIEFMLSNCALTRDNILAIHKLLSPESPGYINSDFEKITEVTTAMPDPVNSAFYMLTRLPSLQAFYDANKRTSRICCNIPLIQSGLSPLSFMDFPKSRYLEGRLAFYEPGDERLAKEAFLDAYLRSAFRFLPLRESAKVSFAVNREKHLADAKCYVVDGTKPQNPIWTEQISGQPGG